MPQPRRRAAPAAAAPPPEQSKRDRGADLAAVAAAAGTAGAALVSGGAGAAAAAAAAKALGGVAAGAPSPAAVSDATGGLLAAVDVLFRQRRAGFMQTIQATVTHEMPGAPADRVAELAQREVEYEVEYQRKARARLERDLPTALRIADPQARAEAVQKILERERRFLAQREQAAAGRVVGALEMDLLKRVSPQGAYWQLSPLVSEHCPKCLAMAGQFWPWEVLDEPGMHLPIHPNCACRLLSLEEAVSQGLMTADQIPDTEDALRRARHWLQEAERLERVLGPEALAEAVSEMETLRLQEASARQRLRWAKGTAKGGQFQPKDGGDAGNPTKKLSHDLASLRELMHHESPAAGRLAKRGRPVKLKGEEHFIPHADSWTGTVKGTSYQSPAGGTNLYRDGILMGEDHPDLTGVQPHPENDAAKAGVPVSDKRFGTPMPDPAPTVLGIPSYKGQELAIGKGAGGSTGAVWAKDAHGDKWLVKTYGGDQDRLATELLSNAIYREMGAKVAEAGTWEAPGLPEFHKIPDQNVGEPPLPKGAKGKGKPRISTGMIVREPDGRLWVYEPKGHFGGYEHTFPKGGLEDGLTPQQNAHKELWEETGLHAHVVGHVGDYEGDTGITRYYMAQRTGGEPHPDDPTPYKAGGSETAAVKLLSPEAAMEALNRGRDKKVLADVLAKPVVQGKAPKDSFPAEAKIPALTYQALPGEPGKITAPNRALGEHYMTDALLANWDFIGLADDNVLWHDGEPLRVDQGGTLTYRAQGKAKPFGPVPSEVWTLNGAKGGQGFGKVDVTEPMMRAQAAAISDRLTPERIDALVDQAPYVDTQMREHVRQALKDRVEWMRRYANGEEALPQPLEGQSARAAMTDWQGGLDPRPEQHAAAERFLANDDHRADVQTHLRSGAGKDKASEDVQATVKHLDSLLRQTHTDGDTTVYVPWEGGAASGAALMGKTVSDKGYLTATTSRGAARSAPTMIQLTVPAGARALYTPQIDGMDEAVAGEGGSIRGDAPTMEVLMARGTRMKMLGHEKVGSRTVLHATVLP